LSSHFVPERLHGGEVWLRDEPAAVLLASGVVKLVAEDVGGGVLYPSLDRLADRLLKKVRPLMHRSGVSVADLGLGLLFRPEDEVALMVILVSLSYTGGDEELPAVVVDVPRHEVAGGSMLASGM
jgi:hypothetical protein